MSDRSHTLTDVSRAGQRFFVTGGSGFVGSHLTRRLLGEGAEVVVYDNLCSGHRWYLEDVLENPALTFVEADLKNLDDVIEASRGCTHTAHFAANPDIARAATEPAVDFWEGTYLTNNVMEACRINGVGNFIYASGSGVYGDRSDQNADETFGPLEPVSTYGASKLGCEAMLSAYNHMFGMKVACFRFANVVGPRQTHGVTYDFVRRLLSDPTRLRILGDGAQSKSYIHVTDVVAAMLHVADTALDGFQVYNAGTADYITVTEIAELTCELLGLTDVEFEYTGGARGWKGDVPIVRFEDRKLRSLGWANSLSSREALADSIESNIAEARRAAEAR